METDGVISTVFCTFSGGYFILLCFPCDQDFCRIQSSYRLIAFNCLTFFPKDAHPALGIDDEFESYSLRDDVLAATPNTMETFVKLLKLDEDRCMFYNHSHATDVLSCYSPFEIENTFCGRQAEYILKSIEGWDASCGPLLPTGAGKKAPTL